MPFLDSFCIFRLSCISTLMIDASVRISDNQCRALMPASLDFL